MILSSVMKLYISQSIPPPPYSSELGALWFFLIWILLTMYVVLDGFDLGVGVLSLFTRDKNLKDLYINAIGPFWDGNEVWLITAVGALFAAFPIAYATILSSFYPFIILFLFGLIFRAVSIKFRSELSHPGWQRFWDFCFGLGSLLAAFLLGLIFGNIFRGLPLDYKGNSTGSPRDLLNPFSILIGVLMLSIITAHGALYMTMRTDGETRERMRKKSIILEIIMGIVFLMVLTNAKAFLRLEIIKMNWNLQYLDLPLAVMFTLFIIMLLYIQVVLRRLKYKSAFISSCVSVILLMGLGALNLFPSLVPSSPGWENWLTIDDSSSTARTHGVMLTVAILGLPIVIASTIYLYRVFSGKISDTETTY